MSVETDKRQRVSRKANLISRRLSVKALESFEEYSHKETYGTCTQIQAMIFLLAFKDGSPYSVATYKFNSSSPLLDRQLNCPRSL